MFTGLILEKGKVVANHAGRLALSISPRLGERLDLGSSLSVAGVCLTVAARAVGRVEFDLSPETLARTTAGSWRPGDEVNLEPALRQGDALGGHWVQGHVDGTTEVVAVELRDAHRQLDVALPVAWRGSVVEKGSVAIDGVSLTVAGLEGTTLRVGLVPHTLAVTTLGALGVGDRVNVELDVLAKYVERQLAFRGVA